MISLTLMSPLEAEVEHDIKKFYTRTGPFTFTWECLSPWAKNKWTSKAGEGGSFDLEMQEKPLSRYSLSLKESPDLTHKNFKGQKDLDNIKHPDIIASKALPSYTFKGGEMVESYDIEALINTKSELGRGEYIKKAVEVAKKNNAKEIVFSEVLNFSEEIPPLQSQKLANARPGVDLWFENTSDYKSALKIINKFDNLVKRST